MVRALHQPEAPKPQTPRTPGSGGLPRTLRDDRAGALATGDALGHVIMFVLLWLHHCRSQHSLRDENC